MSRLRPISLLPSLATLGNLACGIGALILVFESGLRGDQDRLVAAAWLLVLAVVLDSVDGKLARLTRGATDLGAQLDSLADAVTFGVVPAMLARSLVILGERDPALGITIHPRLLVVAPILYAACAVLRLARFNVEHQSEDPNEERVRFAGMPTPAAASLPVALTLFYFAVSDPDFVIPLGAGGIVMVRESILRGLPILLILLAALMVSHIPYPHLGGALSRVKRPFPVVAEVVLIGGVLLVEPALALLLAAILFGCLPIVSAVLGLFARRAAPAGRTE